MNTIDPALPSAGRSKRPLAIGLLAGAVATAVAAWLILSQLHASANATANPEPVQPLAAPVASALPPQLDERLAAIEKTVQQLAASLDVIKAGNSTIGDQLHALGEWTEQADKRAAAREEAAKTRRAIAPRAARPAPAHTADASGATLLGIDTWNGKPSIAIRGADGEVRFLTSGEAIPVSAMAAPGGNVVEAH